MTLAFRIDDEHVGRVLRTVGFAGFPIGIEQQRGLHAFSNRPAFRWPVPRVRWPSLPGA